MTNPMDKKKTRVFLIFILILHTKFQDFNGSWPSASVTHRQTDRRTDGRTDGWTGPNQYASQTSSKLGDNKLKYKSIINQFNKRKIETSPMTLSSVAILSQEWFPASPTFSKYNEMFKSQISFKCNIERLSVQSRPSPDSEMSPIGFRSVKKKKSYEKINKNKSKTLPATRPLPFASRAHLRFAWCTLKFCILNQFCFIMIVARFI